MPPQDSADQGARALRALRDAVDAVAGAGLEGAVPVPVDAGPDAAGLAESLNRLLDEVRARLDALEDRTGAFAEAMERLGDALASTHDRGAMLSAVLEASALILRPVAGAFFVHGGASRLRARAVCGTAPADAELAMGEGLAGAAARGRAVLIWPDPEQPDSDRLRPSPAEPAAGADAAVALPVQAGGRPFGVLALYGRDEGGGYRRADVEALRALLGQLSTAIENSYLYEEAARLSITDGLTGLWNRREFDLRAAGELQRALRFGEPFAFVMIDIDRFKDVNDTYGHQAGDAVLVELARRLSEGTRDVDVVARFGGEEFVLLLPSTTKDGAVTLARKLRGVIDAPGFSVGDDELAITVSMGVSAYPDHGSTVKALLAAADAALYQAKASGRDRVESAIPAGELVATTKGKTR